MARGTPAPVVLEDNSEYTLYRQNSAAGFTEWAEPKPESALETAQLKWAELSAIRAKCAEGKATLEEVQKLLVG